ncbi:hypothetical protein [Thiohalorhabdus sp.]|uniref:hypothetical protein n=1 Tax=Thiohalorhabdus sp. TaxID=3094134 RepID=UPI002FC3374E
MSEEDYRPPLADHWDRMEAKYGDESGDFSFDQLTDEELLEMERLGIMAIYQDDWVTSQEKINLQPLLTLVEKQRTKRGLSAPDNSSS